MSERETQIHHPSSLSRWTVDLDTGCWLWNGSRDRHGYGHCADGRAHRVIYVEFGNELADDHHLHHRCRNKPCVNPDHLEPLTAHEHRTLHGREDSSLSWDDVRDIRRIATEGGTPIYELAARYGLGKSQVHNIIANLKWHDPEYTPGRLTTCRLEECSEQFVATRSHQQFCCSTHRKVFNSRLGWRRRNGQPLEGPSRWRGAKDAA